MSRSKMFRLPQIYKTLHHSFSGYSYAAVPLYRRFCQATGYGGTVQRRESVEEKIARHAQEGTVTTREVVVQFNADVADGMPWKFLPTQREVRVKPGESALAFYTAENRSSTPITGVSTYNVTPMKLLKNQQLSWSCGV
ncbi:cytochrome c oxidase assembly protein CtaG / Cox11 family [Actinidia rufa]|uniref:Cytochrome c oxidase assembly protein CtaG / Cox11 family n=1 Tax=Actinidia rufa TaxID=165716 RepID=A0A7J0DP63_9ERIC|nr:cytochrome c oxidase assembly protein CtaG / Cox11 family [Actinidia rufa]